MKYSIYIARSKLRGNLSPPFFAESDNFAWLQLLSKLDQFGFDAADYELCFLGVFDSSAIEPVVIEVDQLNVNETWH